MSTASKKRKFGDDVMKFYAVRAGKTPGVYMTWPECQENTAGFRGASCSYIPALHFRNCTKSELIVANYPLGCIDKSFTTRKEAEDFVAGKVPSGTSSGARKGEGDKFYAVAVGHVPGVYEDWDQARKQVEDIKGPKYRKFTTRREAEEFVRLKGVVPKKEEGAGTLSKKHAKHDGGDVKEPAAKKVKTGKSASKGKVTKVYTDGACPGNGKKGAIAGVGVFFGVGDPR